MISSVSQNRRGGYGGLRGAFDNARGDQMTDEDYVREEALPDALDQLHDDGDLTRDDVRTLVDFMKSDEKYLVHILDMLHNAGHINSNRRVVPRTVIGACMDIVMHDIIPAIEDEIARDSGRGRGGSRWSTRNDNSRQRASNNRWNTNSTRNERRYDDRRQRSEPEVDHFEEHDSHTTITGISSDDVVFKELPSIYKFQTDLVTLDGYSITGAEGSDAIVGLENMPCIDITVNTPIDGPWQVPNLIRRYGKPETFNKLFPHDRSIVMHIRYPKLLRLAITAEEYENIRVLVAKMKNLSSPTCEVLLSMWGESEVIKKFENLVVKHVNARIVRYFTETKRITYLHELTAINNDISCTEDKVAKVFLASLHDIFGNVLDPTLNISKIRMSDTYGAFCDKTGNDTDLVKIVTSRNGGSQTLDRMAQYVYTYHMQTAIVTNVWEEEIALLMEKIKEIKEKENRDVPVSVPRDRFLITHILSNSGHSELVSSTSMPIVNTYLVKCIYNPLEYEAMNGFVLGESKADLTMRFFHDDCIVSPKATR